MFKRLKLTLSVLIGFMLIITIFIKVNTKDDIMAIAKEINETGIVHVEYLDKNNAISFYESESNSLHFGHALVKKSLFGWKFISGSITDYVNDSSDMKLSWGFSNLEYEKGIEYTDLLKGRIIDDDIKEVKVITEDGKEYLAKVINYGGESFWYLLSKNKDLDMAITTGLSEIGEVIFEYPEQ